MPVLPLDIGGIATVAQIDTGYDDRVLRPSIDINEALFQRLLAAGLPLKRSRDIGVATCEGSETREVYTLPAGVVAITTSTGVVVRELPDAKLVRKLVNGCGGIADMREPAAQLGMSAVAMLGHRSCVRSEVGEDGLGRRGAPRPLAKSECSCFGRDRAERAVRRSCAERQHQAAACRIRGAYESPNDNDRQRSDLAGRGRHAAFNHHRSFDTRGSGAGRDGRRRSSRRSFSSTTD